MGIFLQIINKQCNFQSKAKLNVSALLLKLGLIFVGKDILLICYLMAALVCKSECKAFMKTLQETQTEGTPFRQLRKLSQLPKIVLTK